jgi:tetratricopeptide (TPR) repeat protein
LFFKRSTLASQAMVRLAQAPHQDETLQLAVARLNIASGNFADADDALKQADRLADPNGTFASEKEELWARVHDALGHTEEARKHLERAAVADPKRPWPLLRLSEISARNESWNDAARWMRMFIATRPQNLGQLFAILGEYYLTAHNVVAGTLALETAFRIDPYVYWGHYLMARIYEKNQDTAAAIKEYEFIMHYAYDRDPDNYLKLAALHKNSGQRDQAVRVLAQGHRIFAKNLPIYRLYRQMQVGD